MSNSHGRTETTGSGSAPRARPLDDFSPVPTADPVYRILLFVAHRRNRALLVDWFADQPTYEVIDATPVLEEMETEARERELIDGADLTREHAAGAALDTTDAAAEGVPPEWTTPVDETDEGREPDENRVERRRTNGPFDAEAIDLCLVDVTALDRHGTVLAERIELERPLPLPCLLLASEATARRVLTQTREHELSRIVDDVITTPVEPALLDRRVRAHLRLRRQATELEQRHDQLSLLAQVLRHDVANAATVVNGWGEVLRDEVTPAGVEALERVLRGGQRITELVENSRDLTAIIEAGNNLETEATVLGPVIQMEIDAIERIHASTTRTVSIEFDAPLPTVQVVAGGMLPSVFTNLLSNAVRHSDTETVVIEITIDVEPREVVVRVADNGPGVPDDRKVQIFEPSTKRPDSPGDGLGLALVKRLVDSYGGRIWFEDAPGGGAVACVALRRALSQ